ncbi:hypothetical protein HDU97_002512 [Phlyctochytrium planicorne]|nr:hypothetical protein HDU97_002512 [Phlyctochytrium planicorne]
MAPLEKPTEPFLEIVIAAHDYITEEPTCLSFRKGDFIYVHGRDQSGWWDGSVRGNRGWFPSNYVQATTLIEQRPISTGSEESQKTLKSATQKKLDELQDMLEEMLTEVGKSEMNSGTAGPVGSDVESTATTAHEGYEIRPRSSSINAVPSVATEIRKNEAHTM